MQTGQSEGLGDQLFIWGKIVDIPSHARGIVDADNPWLRDRDGPRRDGASV